MSNDIKRASDATQSEKTFLENIDKELLIHLLDSLIEEQDVNPVKE